MSQLGECILLGCRIYMSYVLYLDCSLRRIALIDAHSIDPKPTSFLWKSEASKESVCTCSDGKVVAIANEMVCL